jgi:hypothetical protein
MHVRKLHGGHMTTLKIEHAVVDFEIWKQAFERDPIGREHFGVRRYRVFRPLDDAKYVLLDLDFDGPAEAKAFLERLREVWTRVDLSPGLARAPGCAVMPQARVVQEVSASPLRTLARFYDS